jgi:hypothetical protein
MVVAVKVATVRPYAVREPRDIMRCSLDDLNLRMTTYRTLACYMCEALAPTPVRPVRILTCGACNERLDVTAERQLYCPHCDAVRESAHANSTPLI